MLFYNHWYQYKYIEALLLYINHPLGSYAGIIMKRQSPIQIMFLGTGSDVGKSIMAGGFGRILYRQGYRVAPFKAQNMALNSFVTMNGDEMGRAQVFQAAACGLFPHSDMNPVLLKPTGESNTQVIVQGKVFGNQTAKHYYDIKNRIMPYVLESYNRLKTQYEALILEGAGSLTEINLKKYDIVNIQMAKLAGAPVVVVADIDKGGVFASLVGTMKLLSRKERSLIIGFIINKFRGSKELFTDGIQIIEKLTKRPVFGVVPYFQDIHLPEEDSVALQHGKKGRKIEKALVKIAVIHLPYISNYTDFDPFEVEDGVSIWYARKPEEIEESSIVIIPGTKNTIEDLLWMKNQGFEDALRKHVKGGNTLIGICGGYQMLGRVIEDPFQIESNHKKIQGLWLLDIDTTMEKEKKLTRVRALCNLEGFNNKSQKKIELEGYEIHMGSTRKNAPLKPSFTIIKENNQDRHYDEGARSENGKVWGTYLHGLFENDDFRTLFLKMHGRNRNHKIAYKTYLDHQFDKLADIIESNVDTQKIIRIAQSFRYSKPL